MPEGNGTISVVVPVYNTESTLFRCAKSILNQTYDNVELIFVDDHSTDLSYSVCEQISAWDSRVTVLTNEGNGVSSARNQGLLHASGEYVHFFDADDYVDLDLYSVVLREMREHSSDVAYFGWIKEGKRIRAEEAKNARCGEGSSEELMHDMLSQVGAPSDYTSYSNYVWNKMFRRDLICASSQGCQLFDEGLSIAEDYEWLMRVIPNASKGVFVPKPFYHHVLSQSSATGNGETKAAVWLKSQEVHLRGLQILKNMNEELYRLHQESCVNYFFSCLKTTAKKRDFESAGVMIDNMIKANDGVVPTNIVKQLSDLQIIYPKYKTYKKERGKLLVKIALKIHRLFGK